MKLLWRTICTNHMVGTIPPPHPPGPLLSHWERASSTSCLSVASPAKPGLAQSNLFFQQQLLPVTRSSHLSLRTIYPRSLHTGMHYKLFENWDHASYREFPVKPSKLDYKPRSLVRTNKQPRSQNREQQMLKNGIN